LGNKISFDVKEINILGNRIMANIENKGELAIDKFYFRIIGINGFELIKVNSSLKSFEFSRINENFNNTGIIEKIEVFPTIIFKGKEFAYPDLAISKKFSVEDGGNGMVAFWDFGESGQSVYDGSGNGNKGYLGSFKENIDDNDPIREAGSLIFDGQDYVTLKNSITPTGEVSIETNLYFEKEEIEIIYSDSLLGFSSKIGFSRNGGSWMGCLVENELGLNEWHKISALYNGSYIKIYINGNLKVECKQSFSIGSDIYTELIGAPYNKNFDINKGFKGKIDYLIIYNRTLTQEEIKKHNQLLN